MDDAAAQHDKQPPTTQLPEWETPKEYRQAGRKRAQFLVHRKGLQTSASTYLDRHLPPHRKYCGLRRRYVLMLLCILLVLVLGLIIGLAVGLTSRARANDNLFLPLPSDTQSFKGDLTFYGPGLGACGVSSGDGDNIVSVSHFLFDHVSTSSNPNSNPLCGLMIRAERFDEQAGAQRSIDLKVVDRCTGCAPTDLDVSHGAFDVLADPNRGRVDVTWAWLSPHPTSR